MSIRYKSFASRSDQDRRFDQLLKAPIVQSSGGASSASNTTPPPSSLSPKDVFTRQTPGSPRKRVTVVSFSPQDNQEVVTGLYPSPQPSVSPPPIVVSPIKSPTSQHLPSGVTVTRIPASSMPYSMSTALRPPILSSGASNGTAHLPMQRSASFPVRPTTHQTSSTVSSVASSSTKRKLDFDSAIMVPNIPVQKATISKSICEPFSLGSSPKSPTYESPKKPRVTSFSSFSSANNPSHQPLSSVSKDFDPPSLPPGHIGRRDPELNDYSLKKALAINKKQTTISFSKLTPTKSNKVESGDKWSSLDSMSSKVLSFRSHSPPPVSISDSKYSLVPAPSSTKSKTNSTSFVNNSSTSSISKSSKASSNQLTTSKSIPNQTTGSKPSANQLTSTKKSSENSSAGVSTVGPAKPVLSMHKSQSLPKSTSIPVQHASLDHSSDISTDSSTNQPLLKKSRSLFTNKKKTMAAYNPRQWLSEIHEDNPQTKVPVGPQLNGADTFDFMEDEESTTRSSATSNSCRSGQSSQAKGTSSPFDDDFGDDTPVPTVSSLRVSKNQKHLFAVVQNVKEAHECQESGETQDLLDDVEYIIEGVKNTVPPLTRCLSILTLANKCLSRPFREVLTAHGLLKKTFSHLHDANCDPTLMLCVAGLFYIVSRDRQPSAMDTSSLKLMLQLLSSSTGPVVTTTGVSSRFSKEAERVKVRLKMTLEKLHQQSDIKTANGNHQETTDKPATTPQATKSGCRHLQLNKQFTPRDLVMESLLNLSTRKASDVFKTEVRELGGLDRVGDATISAVDYFGDDLGPQTLDEFTMDRLEKIFHYLRLMENMTYGNRDNQSHLVQYRNRALVDSLLLLLRLCANNIPHQLPDSQEKRAVLSCLLAILRLMLNISHDNEWTSDRLGGCTSLLELCLECVLYLPDHTPPSRRFDLVVASLGLLVNLAEGCVENRSRLVFLDVHPPNSDDKVNAIEALIKLFMSREVSASNHDLERDDEASGGASKGEEMDHDGAKQQARDELKWRLIEDKRMEKKRKGPRGKRPRLYSGDDTGLDMDDEEEEKGSDSDADSGADVEFLANTEEEEEKLKEKLDSAGQHMEDSLVAAYTALLLGCIMQGSRRYADRMRRHLPDGKFRPMALMLGKLLSFLSLTNAMGQDGDTSILKIIHILEAEDKGGSSNY